MFFEPSSIQERRLDMSYFHEWSSQIANSFFNCGVTPTESLAKIAQQEDLTPHHIEVLAGEANKEIHKHKYAAAKDKYFAADFPLADARCVIKSLQATGGVEKLSAKMPEPVTSAKPIDMFEMFGVKPEEMDKSASVKHELKVAEEKAEFLGQKYKDQAILSKFAADAAEEKFIKQAKEMVALADDQKDRLKVLSNLDEFVKSSGIREGMKMLAKLAYVIGREGLITPQHTKVAFKYFMKQAGSEAPQQLISEWLPTKVINGNHPLYITLKTFKSHKDQADCSCDRGGLVDDKLKLIHQKVRAL